MAFYSPASNLVAGDSNGEDDVFVRDRLGRTTELVSAAYPPAASGAYRGTRGGKKLFGLVAVVTRNEVSASREFTVRVS